MERQLVFDLFKFRDTSPKYKILDEWNVFYGWEVYRKDYMFILYDSQCGEIIENYRDFKQVVTRITTRALDYYSEEYEWEDDKMHISDYNMLVKMITLYEDFTYDIDSRWLKAKKEWLKSMEVYE